MEGRRSYVRAIHFRTHDCFTHDGTDPGSRNANCTACNEEFAGAKRSGSSSQAVPATGAQNAQVHLTDHRCSRRHGNPAHADERREKQIDKSRRHGARGGGFSRDDRDAIRHSRGDLRRRRCPASNRASKNWPAASLRVHFTRLVFSNGYSVTLNGENTRRCLFRQTLARQRDEVAELAPPQLPDMRLAMGGGQAGTTPTLPPLPQVGPPKGLIIGLSLGGTAALVILGVMWCRPSSREQH